VVTTRVAMVWAGVETEEVTTVVVAAAEEEEGAGSGWVVAVAVAVRNVLCAGTI
jgi:hypothetical protein